MPEDKGLKAVQSFGEQHPYFHSKEMNEYRKGLKSKKHEVAKKMKFKKGINYSDYEDYGNAKKYGFKHDEKRLAKKILE